MNCLPQRSPRVQLAGTTPAVLRFENGQRASGKLKTVSLTGGLLSLSNPLAQGSQVKLMFLTRTGSVLGGAEMLPALGNELQPFRFISLPAPDQLRLGATIQASLPQSQDQQWIDKFRAASVQRDRSQSRISRLFGAIGLLALALGSTFYLLHSHWVK